MQELSGEEVLLWPTPGNAGDSFINAGTAAALSRASVSWRRVDTGDDVTGRTVVLGGGGNFTELYDHVDTALNAFLDGGAQRIVLLPHTVRGNVETLRRLRPQDVVMCRDAIGHQHVTGVCRARVLLQHDMAFHLDVDQFLADPALSVSGQEFLEDRLAAHGWTLEQITSAREMQLMRIDAESANPTGPEGFDASHHLIDGDVGELSPRSAWALLACVRACQAVHTDRLHVAIAAAMLGTAARLRPNSYDKNRSVYDHSLASFSTVRFEPWT